MIVVYIVGGLVGLVVLMSLIGLALPRDHRASRRATLAKSPELVWRAISDVDAYPSWRRGLERIERLSPTSFREHGSHGAITFAIDVEEPPSRRVTRISDDTLPFGGTWTYELGPDGAGSILTITEDGFVKNPLFRLLSKTVFSQTATFERFLADLHAHLS